MIKGISIEKILISIIIIAVLVTIIFLFYSFFAGSKRLELKSVIAGENLIVGETYEIKWSSKGIESVGIVLFRGKEASWVAQNINARQGKYNWEVRPNQKHGDDYRIAIFEYPWKDKNEIEYSKDSFSISYKDTDNCEKFSVINEWPYLSSNFPNIRRVFITSGKYNGNMGGLSGADEICNLEAKEMEIGGEWIAFIGGDRDEEVALERLIKTPRGIDGTFVSVDIAGILEKEDTCHRLLAKSFTDFLNSLSDPSYKSEIRYLPSFYENLGGVWLGRVFKESKKNCIPITSFLLLKIPLQEKYSFTATCKDWTTSDSIVKGYLNPEEGTGLDFPTCYTPEGVLTEAVSFGGFSTGTSRGFVSLDHGEPCTKNQKILCVEK